MGLVRRIMFFQDPLTRKVPVKEWLENLRDARTKFRILAHIERAKVGNLGHARSLSEGLYEFKMNFGPGFRIYYTLQGMELIILFVGGDKSSQEKDIVLSKNYLKIYKGFRNGQRN